MIDFFKVPLKSMIWKFDCIFFCFLSFLLLMKMASTERRIYSDVLTNLFRKVCVCVVGGVGVTAEIRSPGF